MMVPSVSALRSATLGATAPLRLLRTIALPRGGCDGALPRLSRCRTAATAAGDALAPPEVKASYLQREMDSHNQVQAAKAEAKLLADASIASFRNAAASQARPEGNGSAAASKALVGLRAKLKNAIGVMQHGLVERDTEVRLLLLAAMSGEHILLIGPPGTAKSEVGRRLNKLISGTYFERLLTRFSVPEELFGPLSMRALEEDKYVRQTTGYLPEAEVAFIDEIFKANSAILNTLLTLINERQFDNGTVRVNVPLLSMVGASNELPESEELDALYDRFLVRRLVRQVSAAGVGQMLTFYSNNENSASESSGSDTDGGNGAVSDNMKLTREDIVACKREALRTVVVPPAIIQMVTDLRSYLQERMEPKVYVSDRRLVKSVQLLQVAAYCNGRRTVTEYDVLLLQHVLWQRPEQADRINDWVMGQLSVDDGVKQVEYLLKGLFTRACRSLGDATKASILQAEAASLRSVLSDKFNQIAMNMDGDRFQDNLWLGAEEAEAIASALEPRLKKTSHAVSTVLTDACVLEVALKTQSNPVMLANLMPKYWADFIRSSDIADVAPLGTTPMSAFKGSRP